MSRTVHTLIDEAVILCSGQSGLARSLGITPGDVNSMVRGKRTITPATVGQLCDLLGLDGEEARRLAAEAVIAAAKPEKQGVLRRAFFALSATGAASGAVVMIANAESVITVLRAVSAVIESTMYRASTRLGAGLADRQSGFCQLGEVSRPSPLC